MIKINSTVERNLAQICEEHFQNLRLLILGQLGGLKQRQSAFIRANLRRILTALPNDLYTVHQDFKRECTTIGRGKLKNYNNGLASVFNYKRFTKTDANYYCGYDLATKLKVNTCPYCNRSYTVTIDQPRRTVRPDFDHFYPKSKFPLLALSFYNLIPSCLTCNRSVKGQATINAGKYSNPYFEGFEDCLKFNFYPNDYDSAIGIKENYVISYISDATDRDKSIRCANNMDLFKLTEIYQESHKGEIADIVRRHHISNGKYLEILHKQFPGLGSIAELYRVGFGNYYSVDDFAKRPLSKLTKDVVEQLIFEVPTLSNKP